MTTMIQIRNVPDDLHRAVKARAALAGKSVSAFILDAMRDVLALRSEQELLTPLRAGVQFSYTSRLQR